MMVIGRIIFYLIVLSFTPLLPLIARRGTDLPARAQDDSEELSRGEKPEKKAREGENPWVEQQVSWPRVAELPKEAQADMVMYSEDCYCIYNGSRYGFLSADGEEITPFLYDQAAPFSEGLACVSHHGKYGFIGRDGRTKIPFLYDQASSFSEGLAYFCLGEDYGFLDYEGNVVLRPECDSVSTFREGLAYFSMDGLYGYLDKNGKIVAEPIYEDAGQFQNGLAMVVQNGKYGLIGRDGRQVLDPEYDWIDVADGFIRVQKDGKMYCFDKESGRRLTEGWDWITIEDGMLVVSREDGYGLLDGDGNLLLQPEYKYVDPIPDHDLVIVKKSAFFGVIDYEGEEKIPCEYYSISYDDSGPGGLRVFYGEGQRYDGARGGCGYFSFTEEGTFLEIPPEYSYIYHFQGDLAVVKIGDKYGAIRRNGELELPVKYDDVELYQNGSISFSTGKLTALYDSDRKLFKSGLYDNIAECGKGYLIRENCRYGYLDEAGNQVIPSVYCNIWHNVYGTISILRMVQSCEDSGQTILVIPEEVTENGVRDLLFGNYLTPRAGAYEDFIRNGSFAMEIEEEADLGEFPVFQKFGKLYRIEGMEEPILYLCTWFAEYERFSDGYDGFFSLRDGKVEKLKIKTKEGTFWQGGSACFLYDKEEGKRRLGLESNLYDGYGGYCGYDMCVLEPLGDGMKVSVDCLVITCDIEDYSEEELLENASLFYDEDNVPHTKETVLKAWDVTEYQVDGERTTLEHYREVNDRYEYLKILDRRRYGPRWF